MCFEEHISGETVNNSGSETRRIYGGASECSNVGEQHCSGAKYTRDSSGESISGELFARSNDGERKATLAETRDRRQDTAKLMAYSLCSNRF